MRSRDRGTCRPEIERKRQRDRETHRQREEKRDKKRARTGSAVLVQQQFGDLLTASLSLPIHVG